MRSFCKGKFSKSSGYRKICVVCSSFIIDDVCTDVCINV